PCSLSLSFLLRPPPTTSPPFPYTTLFRSAAQGTRTLDLAVVGEQGRRTRHCRSCQRQHDRARAQKNTLQPHRRQHWVIPPKANRDRKSTRLNSSHQIISYAVFCLKKKTNQ